MNEEYPVKKQIRFITDAMLGSLTRWLRLLGFNTLYCETQSDNQVLEQIQERILLTRDKKLITRAQNQGFHVVNPGTGSIQVMLERLKQKLELNFIADPDQSRCPQCNSTLIKRNRNQVQKKVPSGSLRKHDEFWQCRNPRCQQVYWQGRHWVRIQKTLRQLNKEESNS